MTKIRNIIQTAMSREIIKTAPDMVVYMDSYPFILHPYMRDKNNYPVVINFNDYITSISTSYGIDTLTPSGNISLSIPNGYKQLFKAPGGGLIIECMSEIQIFAKSYFFSSKQNTLMRRIFNGLIKSVDYNELATSLEITIGISGVLHILEMTKMALNPGVVTAAPGAIALATNQAYLNPVQAIRDCFVRQMDFSDIQITAIPGQEYNAKAADPARSGSRSRSTKPKPVAPVAANPSPPKPLPLPSDHPLHNALEHNFIEKWNVKLAGLWPHVHIFGLSTMDQKEIEKSKSSTASDLELRNPAVVSRTLDEQYFNIDGNNSTSDYNNDAVRQHHFDQQPSTGIPLTAPTPTSRLERIKSLADMICYEAYQDIDGAIIFKPPLYNLDCTILGKRVIPQMADENLTESSNPFIINLSEVINESYAEDESAIRRTRMTVTGNLNPHGTTITPDSSLILTSDFTDVNLARKFGIRDEAPKYLSFLGWNRYTNMAYAAAELAKINLGFKTYHVTIPMRPEIRIGFPIYIPHLDMYAYITSVGISYNVGGRADMNITANACRKRLQFPVKSVINGKDVINYESIPNLVHKFITVGGNESLALKVATGFPTQGSPATLGDSDNNFISRLQPKQLAEVDGYLTTKIGSLFEIAPTTEMSNWRIQNDSGGTSGDGIFNGWQGESFKATPYIIGPNTYPAGKKIIIADGNYISALRAVHPYTDEKGYEVISPFPWGRYASLTDAIFQFTRGGLIGPNQAPSAIGYSKGALFVPNEAKAISDVTSSINGNINRISPFLLAGLAAPNLASDKIIAPLNTSILFTSATNSSSTDFDQPGKKTMLALISLLANSTLASFELDYSGQKVVENNKSLMNKQINTILKHQTTTLSSSSSNLTKLIGAYNTTPPTTSQVAASTRTVTFLGSVDSTIASFTTQLTNILNENSGSPNSNNDISLLPQTTDLGTFSPGNSLDAAAGNLVATFNKLKNII